MTLRTLLPRAFRRQPAAVRIDTHVTAAQAVQRPGIDTQSDQMPRAEDDVATRASSPEFHDRQGSGSLTRDRKTFF